MMKRILILAGLVTTLSPTVIAQASANEIQLTDQPEILKAISQDLNPKVAAMSIKAFNTAEHEGKSSSMILTVIDYSMPSNKKRLWVFDLAKQKTLFHTLVAHASKSGDLYAKSFSNKIGSHKSSPGLYVTKGTYYGHEGYSLRLDGLEKGINEHALQRAVVIHGAWYAEPDFAKHNGRLGRSWGCPALPTEMVRPVIDTIKGGSLMFVYAPDSNWLHHSHYVT